MNVDEIKEEIMELKWRISHVKEGDSVVSGMRTFDKKKAEARVKQLEKQLALS